MTPTDREAFGLLLYGLGETYGEPVSETKAELYWRALEDLSLEAVRKAATVHVRTQRFFPRPAELREAITGSVPDRAEVAWVELLALVRRVGFWQIPTWGDPVMKRAALELYGGWKQLCEQLPNDGVGLHTAAKEFKALYAAYARRDAQKLPALPDRDEARELLGKLRTELDKRKLPAPGLPKARAK